MSFFNFRPGRAASIVVVLVCTLLFFASVTSSADTEAGLSPATTDCSLVTEIPQAECQELVDFYDATDGDNWNDNSGWKQTNTPCSWYGVLCSAGYVSRLSLSNNGLSGNIPDFSYLPNLEGLNLSYNQLSDSIPDFASLPNLQYLFLYNNQLSGNIPDFSSLPNLQDLELDRNQLSGSIPDFPNLPDLQYLYLHQNQLSGSIPDFSNLPNLQNLYLSENQLSGSIPDFSSLPSLKDIVLSSNQLSDNVPDFSSLPDLEFLYLYDNQLSGSVPDFSNLPNLKYVRLEKNQLNGNIPANLCSLPLSYSDFGYNKLDIINTDPCVDSLDSDWKDTQTVPPTNVQALALSGAEVQLIWDPIPYTGDGGHYEVLGATTAGGPYTSYGTTSSKSDNTKTVSGLTPGNTYHFVIRTFTPAHGDQQNDLTSENSEEVSVLTATNCSLVTEIPPAECQELVDFYDATDGDNWNDNSGWTQTNTPCSWYGVSCDVGHVSSLSLSFNELSGSIPDFPNLPNLQYLYLEYNQLSGSIPDFSDLPNLTRLYLSGNQLSGTIQDFINLPNLTHLKLGHNQLSGSLPNFSNLPNLVVFSVYNNQLSGTIPDFSNLSNLGDLNISYNQLSGNIPNFSNLSNLGSLWIDNNQLSGSIPDFSNVPNLQIIQGYSNQLSGPIPDFSNLPNLNSLYLDRNQLSGSIPDFSNLSNLSDLSLSSNQLSGSIPDFSNLPNMGWELNLGGNQLSGAIPDFSHIPKLKYLSLYSNQLSDAVPDFSNLPNLEGLSLYSNQLSGNIPDFSNLPNLAYLYLQNNQLSGTILANICSLPLSWTDFGYNKLDIIHTDPCVDSLDSDWKDTQTVPPTNVQASALSGAEVQLTWDIIPYTGDGGHYEVLVATTAGGPYTSYGTTSSKLDNNKTIMGLTAGSNYHFVIRTFTPAHGSQQNDLTSENSEEVLASTICALVTEIPQAECQELVDFYDATDGDNWNDNSGWTQTNTPCSWYGVSCDAGHVSMLSLGFNGLSGSIPDFTNLPNLQELALYWNQLSGNVPDFSNLPNLTTLSLEYNQLNGSVPDFSNISNLQELFLFANQLSGSVPDISNLPNLLSLGLGSNQLDGSIPDFSNLPNLIGLHLDGNHLDGSIPDFSNLPNLQNLVLYTNQLSGGVPDFTSLPNLKVLYLSENQLSGSVPDFANLPNLEELYLHSNQLDGSVLDPTNLPNLLAYSQGKNQLTGGVPEFTNIPNLEYLSLAENQLSGGIPDFANLSNLQELYLHSNQFDGNVPVNLCTLPLSYSDFGYNKLDIINTDPCVDSLDSDWKDTQTVPPTNVQASALSGTEVQLTWDPIPYYTGDGGYYDVLGATITGGPYTSYGTTSNKLDNSKTITGLTAGSNYYFVIRTFTPSHENQQNDLTSENSEEVSVNLTAIGTDGIDVTLSWTTDPVYVSYEVLYSTDPYFQPDDAGVTIETTTSNTWTHPGAAAGVDNNYSYLLRGVYSDGSKSEPFNRSGEFTFGLVGGN